MPRVTITLPADLVEAIRARVGPRETSSWIAQAISDRLAREQLTAAVSDYEVSAGAITEEDIAAARERTEWTPKRPRRKSPAA